MRWLRRSKSIVTLGGSLSLTNFSESALLLVLPSFPSSTLFLSLSSDLLLSSGLFSSSLSGARGDGRSFRKTITYALLVTGLPIPLIFPPPKPAAIPRSVLAIKYRYLPLLSNAGHWASLMPSVGGVDFHVSTEST